MSKDADVGRNASSINNCPFFRQPPFPSATALSLGNRPFLTTTLSYLSSRAKPRDLRFRGPFLEMFFDRPQLLRYGTYGREGKPLRVDGPGAARYTLCFWT
jgi:hypothetical protein